MKKNVVFLTFTLLFCYFCFASTCAVANVTATIDADFDEDDKPTADPDSSFDFNISFNIPQSTPYCTITVTLTSSNFKGIAANVGDSLKNDLFFDNLDNYKWHNVSDDGTTLTYNYSSTNTAIPKTIKVRCRDYGAHGSIQITANDVNVVTTGDPLHIPIDENWNDIADGWEKDNGIYIPKKKKKNGDWDAAEAIAKASADDERGPIDAILLDAVGKSVKRTCVNNGDGWSVYDEYRGLFTKIKLENGEEKPDGYTRLNPNIKDVMYTSHKNVAKHGTGNLPSIDIHAFMHVDYRLYQKEMKDGKDILNPFTNIYTYQKAPPYKVGHIEVVDSRIGRVNYNSNPDGGAPSVPGAKSVWSIRIKDNGSDGVRFQKGGKPYVKRLGNATPGSPSQYSLAVVLTSNIDVDLNTVWERDVDRLAKQKVKDAKAKHIAAAKKKLIPFVIGHEVGHCLNITAHCKNPNCIMSEDTEFVFFANGSFHIIKKKYDKKKDKIVNVTDGQYTVTLDPADLILSHVTNIAVTGQPGTHNNAIDCYFDIGFMGVADQSSSSSSDTSSDTSSALSYSLVPSDGVYTAYAGNTHTANFSTSSPYSFVYWYLKAPSDTAVTGQERDVGDGSLTTADFTYTFPSGVSGNYVFSVYVYDGDNTTIYEESYTVSVSLPPVTTPVWSAIPDYNLTVGDYFYLVFSDYVSGSPTLTWDSGSKPAGSSFSDGMLSGSVSKAESCRFRVKATNSAGSAYSDWINFTISAPVVTATRPDAPTGLSVSAGSTAGTVVFSWTAPSDNGSAITDYKVAYGSYKNRWGGWTPYTSIGSNSTTYTFTGLESGTAYRFRVRAVNGEGDGRFSRYAQITVP